MKIIYALISLLLTGCAFYDGYDEIKKIEPPTYQQTPYYGDLPTKETPDSFSECNNYSGKYIIINHILIKVPVNCRVIYTPDMGDPPPEAIDPLIVEQQEIKNVNR